MSPRQTFATVSNYLAALEPAHRRALRRVIASARKAVPGATLVISYGIPALKQGRVFIYCAAFKKHIGVYPPVRKDAKLRAALKPYANAKGNLSFALDQAVPVALIARVAKALARQYAHGSKAPPNRPARSLM